MCDTKFHFLTTSNTFNSLFTEFLGFCQCKSEYCLKIIYPFKHFAIFRIFFKVLSDRSIDTLRCILKTLERFVTSPKFHKKQQHGNFFLKKYWKISIKPNKKVIRHGPYPKTGSPNKFKKLDPSINIWNHPKTFSNPQQ